MLLFVSRRIKKILVHSGELWYFFRACSHVKTHKKVGTQSTAKPPPRTGMESPPKGPTIGSGEPPEGRTPKNPGRNLFFTVPLKGPTRGSENFTQNAGPCGGSFTVGSNCNDMPGSLLARRKWALGIFAFFAVRTKNFVLFRRSGILFFGWLQLGCRGGGGKLFFHFSKNVFVHF